MMEKFPTGLYKIHPLPVPQANLSAFIKPQNKFITLSHDKRTYSFVRHDELLNCKSTEHHLICQHNSPVYETDGETACEYQLLTQPDSDDLNNCEINILFIHRDHWTYLSSTGRWLYSLEKSTTLQILCHGQKDFRVTLLGTGILWIKGLCTGRINRVTLIGTQELGKIQEPLYLPRFTLNISLIDNNIHEKLMAITNSREGTKFKTTLLDD